MKLHRHLLAALLVMAAFPFVISSTSCERKSADDANALLADASEADSLLYYFGKLRAREYWHAATNDTTLRNEEQRRLFLKGLRDGLDAMKEDLPAYNYGFNMGVKMARNIIDLESEYGVDMDKEILFNSIRNGVEHPQEDVDVHKLQDNFYSVLVNMRKEKLSHERKHAVQSLAELAAERKMAKVNDNLYYIITNPGEAPRVRRGDIIYVNVDYTTPSGDDLGMPSPERLTVGENGMPKVMTEAYSLLDDKGSGVFATSAGELFGDRSEMVNLKSDDIVLIHVTVKDVQRDVENAE